MPFPWRVEGAFTPWLNCVNCLNLAISDRVYMERPGVGGGVEGCGGRAVSERGWLPGRCLAVRAWHREKGGRCRGSGGGRGRRRGGGRTAATATRGENYQQHGGA